MRPRFVFFGGPQALRYGTRVARSLGDTLPHSFERGALCLLTSQSAPLVPLPTIGGWILGQLFEDGGRLPCEALTSAHQLAIASTGGGHLLARWSGRYVAFWSNSSTDLHVLRDPSAACRALWTQGEGWVCFASDAEMLMRATTQSPEINWPSIAHYLRFPQLPTADTCLTGIHEVLPGERLSFGLSATTATQLWSPWSFCTAAREPRASAGTAEHLAATIDAVVAGWSRCFGRVALELSGGLDSSILAAALARTNRPWVGINIATEALDGDELSYARSVAEHCRADLVERRLLRWEADPRSTPTRLTPRPGGMGIQRGFDRAVVGQVDRVGADVLMSGTGGDNVFCLLASSAPVLDSWRAGGLTFARVAVGDLAVLAQSTTVAILRQSIKRWLSGLVRERRWLPDDAFLAGDVRPPVHTHPWLDLPRDVPHGSWGHIAAILRAHPVLDAHDRASDHEMLFPLLSQPVMEACLAIPSWQWIAGGRDRSVARAAFTNRLPDAVVARRRKGHLTSIFAHAYDRARGELGVLLNDGLLAEAGLIDRRAVASFVTYPASVANPAWHRILELVDAELWARHVRDFGIALPSR